LAGEESESLSRRHGTAARLLSDPCRCYRRPRSRQNVGFDRVVLMNLRGACAVLLALFTTGYGYARGAHPPDADPEQGASFRPGPTPPAIPFDVLTNHIYVQARVNSSSEPLTFILDSGASTILDTRCAERLGLAATRRSHGLGTRRVDARRLDRLAKSVLAELFAAGIERFCDAVGERDQEVPFAKAEGLLLELEEMEQPHDRPRRLEPHGLGAKRPHLHRAADRSPSTTARTFATCSRRSIPPLTRNGSRWPKQVRVRCQCSAM